MLTYKLNIAQCAAALLLLVRGAYALPQESSTTVNRAIQPFKIDLSKQVPHMLDLIKRTELPDHPVDSSIGATAGIDLSVLKQLQNEWIHKFDWKAEQRELNRFRHFTTNIEGIDIHYIHEKSKRPNAIPLILLHGWPGSFLEFIPLIEPLTKQAKSSTGKPVSYDVIIPSLPGYAFSGAAPANWTVDDTARIFNTLMTDLLGYKTFAVHGTDWGSAVAYSLYGQFNKTVRALHAVFVPFYPLRSEQLAAANISLSPSERFQQELFEKWSDTGNGYILQQSTKPNTIGLALQDNPVGQLAWIGEKFIEWSDPRAGTAPSVLDHREIIRSVSLYYLTKTFTSAVFTYYSNPTAFRTNYTKAPTDAPLLFSSFKYNVAFWPRALIEKLGNLVYYKSHEFGGHFPGIDNPPALIDDIREIKNYWQ